MNRVGMDAWFASTTAGAWHVFANRCAGANRSNDDLAEAPEQMMLDLEAQRKAAAAVKGTDDSLNKTYQQELTA